MTTIAENTAIEVSQSVRRLLRDSHPGGVTLDVIVEGIRLVGDWWHVPVRPSVEPPHTFEFYDALAVVEGKINEDEGMRVVLVPVMPEEAVAVLA